MALPMMRVWAVGDLLVGAIAEDGRAVPGRYVARDPTTRAALAEGALVPQGSHFVRAITRGELTTVAPIAPKPAKAGDS